MSDVIVRWLNDDVRLSKKVTTFERDFANGYLFGELLSKHGLLKNFEVDFKDDQDYTCKRQNFAALRAAFGDTAQALGVKLKDEQVTEIMNQDRGTSLRILFQMRKGLALLRNSSDATGQPNGVSGQSTTLAPKGRTARFIENPKAERFFESQLAPLRAGDPRADYELHTKQFVDEHTDQMQKAMVKAAREEQKKVDNRSEFRETRIARMQKVREEAAALQDTGIKAWQSTMQRKWGNVEKDLVLEKEMARREQQRVENVRLKHAQDAGYAEGEDGYGIGWFEKNLQRIGIDTSEEAGSTVPTIVAATAKELYQKMGDKLPTKAQMEIESHNRLKRIKETKVVTDRARLERERRRRKGQVEQLELQSEIEQQRQEQELLAWLQTETEAYRKEAAAHDLEVRRKEALRLKRETEQRARADVMENRMQETLAATAAQALLDREAKVAEMEALKAKGVEAFLSDSDEEVPQEVKPVPTSKSHKRLSFADMRTSVTKGSLCGESVLGDRPRSAMLPAGKDMVGLAQEPAVAEYLFMRGGWEQHLVQSSHLLTSSEAPVAAASGPGLGSLAHWICSPTPGNQVAADLPSDFVPLIAVTGCPVGLGDGSIQDVAVGVAEEFQYTTVSVPDMLVEAWMHCRRPANDILMDWPPLARLVELAQEFASSEDGAAVNVKADSVAELLFRKVELLSAPPPPKVAEPPPEDAKKKPKAAPKKKDAEEKKEYVRPQGVMVLDFPVDIGQCDAWFRALSGYCSPLLRQLGNERDYQKQVSAVLAPWWLEDGWSSSQQQATVHHPAGGEALATAALPLDVLCLQHKDHGSLTEYLAQVTVASILAEEAKAAADATAAAEAAKHAHKEKKGQHEEEAPPPKPPALQCAGVGGQIPRLESPVDKAWLFEQGQAMAEAFLQSQGCQVKKLQPPEAPEAEEAEADAAGAASPPPGGAHSSGVALYKQLVKDEVSRVVEAREAAAAAAAAAAVAPAAGGEDARPAEQAPAAEAAAATPVADAPTEEEAAAAATAGEATELAAGEGQEAAQEADVDEPAVDEGPKLSFHELDEEQDFRGADLVLGRPALSFANPWDSLSPDLQLEMRANWLSCASGYLHGVQTCLKELSILSMSYGDALGTLQQQFLNKLQLSDSKGSVLSEWLQGYPAKASSWTQDQIPEKMEEISDRLWQVTDLRRGEAVAERQMHMEGSFWEEQAMGVIRQVVALQSVEYGRFNSIADLLSMAYREAGAIEDFELPPDLDDLGDFDEGAENVDLEDLLAWLHQVTQTFVNAPLLKPVEEAGFSDGVEQLYSVIALEKQNLNNRLCMLESWANVHLREMRSQLDEVFRRMDDWITDRVWAENEAIKAAMAHVRAMLEPTTDAASPSTSPVDRHRQHSLRQGVSAKNIGALDGEPSSPTSPAGSMSGSGSSNNRKRREAVRLLDPKPLAVEVYRPVRRTVPEPPRSGSPETRLRAAENPNRWTQRMLAALLSKLLELSQGAAVAIAEDVFSGISCQWHFTFRLQEKLVPPAIANRSVDALQLMCENLVSPSWGTSAVDLLELLLTLTFQARSVAWPSIEALQVCRRTVETSLEDPYAFPDVPISEALFLQLPLWGHAADFKLSQEPADEEQSDGIKKWIYQLFLRLEAAAAGGQGGAPELSARRLFSYLALGDTPSQGLLGSLKCLLPKTKPKPPPEEGTEAEAPSPKEEPPPKAEPKAKRTPSKGAAKAKSASRTGSKASMVSQVSDGHKAHAEEVPMRVQDLWRVLFADGRHMGCASHPRPSLEEFHTSLKQAVEEIGKARTDAAAAAAAAPKAKGGKQAKAATPQPPEDESMAGLMVAQAEEAVLPYNEHKLMQNPAIARALSDHGALLCRSRAPESLFGAAAAAAAAAAPPGATEVEALKSLIPPPQAPSPEAPSEGMQSKTSNRSAK